MLFRCHCTETNFYLVGTHSPIFKSDLLDANEKKYTYNKIINLHCFLFLLPMFVLRRQEAYEIKYFIMDISSTSYPLVLSSYSIAMPICACRPIKSTTKNTLTKASKSKEESSCQLLSLVKCIEE